MEGGVAGEEPHADGALSKTIEDYQRRANEARSQASDAPNKAIRMHLLRLADALEELAKELLAVSRRERR
jgi:hypothetical protein